MQPACGSRVTRPPSSANVRRLGVNVANNDVGLDFVTLHPCACVASVDRVEHSEKLSSLGAVAKHGERNHRPDCGMRILPAIFADAGRISLDVAGVMPCIIEGWS